MTTTNKGRVRGLSIAATGLSLAISAVAPAQAIDRVGEGFSHFIDCAGLLLTAPAAHAANCLPNRVPDSLSSLATPTAGAPVVTTPPPVVPPPEPPPGSGPEET